MPGSVNDQPTKALKIEDLLLKEQFIQHLWNLDIVQTLLVPRGRTMKRPGSSCHKVQSGGEDRYISG